jgi:mobilization protein NikA
MAASRELFAVDLRGLREPLLEEAKSQGVTASELARRIIAASLNARADPIPLRSAVNSKNGAIRRMSLRLSSAESAALAKLAQEAGLSRSAYLSTLLTRSEIGTDVVGARQFGPVHRELVDALVKSNSELAAIGRNLNQVARSLNTWPGKTTAAERKVLAVSTAAVQAHLDVASALVLSLRPPRARRGGGVAPPESTR